MEFKNLTPFPTINYFMLDNNDNENIVVVMKTTYQLIERGRNVFQAEIVDDNKMLPLCIQDEYRSEINHSMVLQESDLSPFKPYCDIIINGAANTPDNRPVTKLPVSVTLTSAENNILLNKKIIITGEHQLRKKDKKKWELIPPQPFTSLPIDWSYAFGGECRINEKDENFNIIPKNHLLSQEDRNNHPDKSHPPLAHTVYPYNPLGYGYAELWYLTALQTDTLPAPRIMFSDSPFTIEAFEALIEGKANFSDQVYKPAGLGIISRSWQPRLARAGTYDQQWLEQRHPYLPKDFNFSYWNAAPQDQQIAYLPPGSQFVLDGFYTSGTATINLANHEALVLLRMADGRLIPQRMKADTLILNTDEKQLTITWRIVLDSTLPIRVLEARYETTPEQLSRKLLPII